MATEHVNIVDPEIHEPKGVASASAGDVYKADGAGSGSWQPENIALTTEVVVSSSADFPDAVSNVITLAADTIYVLDGDIDIGSDRFVMSANSGIVGRDSQVATLTSATTGNLFTASSNFTLKGFSVTATSGTIFACTGGASESAYLKEFTITSCSSVGTFTAWYSLFWDKGAVASSTSPLSFAGACTILILDLVEWITGYTTAVDLSTATFNTCTFNRCGFGYASATNHIVIAASSANINSGKTGRIESCTFDSGATNIVANYSEADLQWVSRNNLNLESSVKAAQGYMHTTTTTTIGAGDGDSGNPKLVTGSTNWVSALSDQFTNTTGGRFTYNGQTKAEFLVRCNITGTAASGTQTFNHYIAKNGTIVTASKTQREYTSTATGSPASASAIVELDTNDYVELYVENNTGTNNWDSYILNMTIVEVL